MIILIVFLIFFSFLTLAIEPDILSFIPEMVGISGFIVILITLLISVLDQKNESPSTGFILVFALILRLLFLFHPPTLSDDIYRYCLDGIMLINGHNPYSYTPIKLLGIGQSSDFIKNIYPEISKLLPLVNHPEFTTIYPPAAQILFAVGAVLGTAGIFIGKTVGISLDMTFIVISIKFTLIIMDTLSCLLIILILRKMKLPAFYGIIYAWHPLPILEIASSGHIDGAAIFFLLMAIYLPINFRTTKEYSWNGLMLEKISLVRDFKLSIIILSGIFIGLSIITKFIPIIFFPCWLFLIKSVRKKIMAAISTITVSIFLIITFGSDIINSFMTLGSYLQHWEFSGFFFRFIRDFMQDYPIDSGKAARIMIAMIFIFINFLIYYHQLFKRNDCRAILNSFFMVALIWTILTPTLYPWYALYLVALLPFALNSKFNITGITLSWSVFLSYKVLILYKLTGEWVEDAAIPFMIMAAPLTALILQIYMKVCKNRL